MIRALIARFQQKHRTVKFPAIEPILPARFRGTPVIDRSKCISGCDKCSSVCPTKAIQPKQADVDLGKCIFCLECSQKCPAGAVSNTRNYRLAGSNRESLVVNSESSPVIRPLKPELLQLFKYSLKLRQVSAGGCNACESDLNVLGTVVYDLGRFGIQFVASPRHADGLVISGPITNHMKEALLKTYDSVSLPKVVIVVGSCAISGGVFNGNEQVRGGAEGLLPIDLYIPGCPPHPTTILDGFLRLLGRR